LEQLCLTVPLEFIFTLFQQKELFIVKNLDFQVRAGIKVASKLDKDMLKKFCGRCKRELAADSKYLLCEDCHKTTIFLEDDREYYENSRLHY
jgi:hypothetical protein